MNPMNKRQLTKWREDYRFWHHPCLGEGLYLHVHFDEKDDIKRLGGRWNPAPNGAKGGHWWMPKNKLTLQSPDWVTPHRGSTSGTIEDWLNHNEMIAGQYGELDATACKDTVSEMLSNEGTTVDVYHLVAPDSPNLSSMVVYSELDVVMIENQDGDTNWLTMNDARTVWQMLMEGGHRKVVEKEEAA